MNKIYFNDQYNYADLLRRGNIVDFEAGAINKPAKRQLGTADDLFKFEYKLQGPISIKDYDVFDFIEVKNHHSIVDTKRLPDYLVKKDYYKQLDNLLLSNLTDYQRLSKGVYEKKIAKNFSLYLDFNSEREDIGIALCTYHFPCFLIKKYDEEYYLQADVQRFIFTGSDSFVIFYLWTRSLLLDLKDPLKKDEYEKSKPLVYSQKGSESLIISNHKEKIEQWNYFISTLLNLFLIHFRIYESWIIRTLK